MDYVLDDAAQAKFWARVDRTPGCWVWTGTLNRGHPQFSLRVAGKRAVMQGARYAYLAAVGPIDRGDLHVIRSCAETRCVRPDHLVLASPSEYRWLSDDERARRYWATVDTSAGPGGCWPWTGYHNAAGYGQAPWRGRSTTAHRGAHMRTAGPPAPGQQACHHCDNPPCCNPDHLYWGSASDNAQDRERRERAHRRVGTRSPAAKLTAADVEAIRRRSAAGETYKELAAAFDIHPQNVGRVVRREGYRDVG